MPKLYIIDGMSLVFRAYHAMHGSNLKMPNGEPSGAIFGFTNIITSFLEKENPEYIAVLFDTAEPTFRHELYPQYKANRAEFPEELVPQLRKIKELLDHLSIQRIEMPGFEADDIAGTLSKIAADKGFDVYCLTSDKDFYQLVSDKVKLIKPALKGADFNLIGFEQVKEKFGGEPRQVIDVLALIGDSSDNIPGVRGIGEKTAIPLIQKYDSIEKIYEHIDEIESNSIRQKLINGKDSAFLSKTLVTIKTDMNIAVEPEIYVRKEPNYNSLDNFFHSVGFNTIRMKWKNKAIEAGLNKETGLDIELSSAQDLKVEQIQEHAIGDITHSEHNYIFVNSLVKLDIMLNELSGKEIIAFDLETSSLDTMNCSIVGIAVCAEENKAYYIPVDERLDVAKNKPSETQQNNLFSDIDTIIQDTPFESSLSTNNTLKKLKPLLENPAISKCGQNCKFDALILKRYGIEVSPVGFDSMIASYLLNPDEQHNLNALSQKWLSYKPIPINELIGDKKANQKSMRDIEPEKISDYACEDADLALKLRNILDKELSKSNLLDLAYKLEFPLIEVLTRMEFNGVAVNIDALREISEIIDIETKKLTKKIYAESGIEFNIDSPKQLGHILFEKLMLPPMKSGKTGYSTDIQVLSQLAVTYPIAEYVVEYRQLVKLKTTYVDVLPKLVNKNTGRIHTTFNQTIASTGRLSSTDPNLQNIPIRTDLGKEIRRAFSAQDKAKLIFSADYSQIELRIMAHICGDAQLIEGFKQGLDIHSNTAAILFDIPFEEVNSDKRRVAKTVNFGIMYGLGSFGLSQRLGMSRGEAKEIIDNYFKKYPGIKKYIDETIKSTQEIGYAETLLGRKRYFPDINSKNRNLRQAAERAAINMPIQGTASDMMKIAMIEIDKEMLIKNLSAKMILQVHDELLFEVPKEELEILQNIVVEKMEAALSLGEVPVIVDTGYGENWFLAH